jgi:voltage-gated potassium channel Kch
MPVPRGEAATVTRGQRPARARWHAQESQGRYGLLLILLLATYLMSAFSADTWVAAAQLGLFVATAILALRSTRLPRAWVRAGVAVGATGSVAALILAVTAPSDFAVGLASLWTGILLLATVVLIVRRILSLESVTLQSIYAVISSYLILGLMFAAFFAAESKFHTGQRFFAEPHDPANSRNFQYFSFTTLTTLGYGDFTAADPGGRAIAVIEALTGQIFLATLVARLVAAFRGPAERAAAAAGPPPGGPAPAGDTGMPDAAAPPAGCGPAGDGEPPRA